MNRLTMVLKVYNYMTVCKFFRLKFALSYVLWRIVVFSSMLFSFAMVNEVPTCMSWGEKKLP